jgi:2-dehydropantoate 2-reductase
MRHAVLGAGGICLLVGGALARAGDDVVLLVRAETLDRYDGRLEVVSPVLGDFTAQARATAELDVAVDVLWVTTKATQLEAALALAPPAAVGDAVVVPLLNGIDHVAWLRERYPRVVAGTIRVESERAAPGRVRQATPFARMELAGDPALAETVGAAGIACSVRDDELSMLWDKLAFLAPVALATTALDAPVGAVRTDERHLRARDETNRVAAAEGARIDVAALLAQADAAPAEMRSSMQKDVDAGRVPELDAIAGPILRGGARHGIPTPATAELVELVKRRG